MNNTIKRRRTARYAVNVGGKYALRIEDKISDLRHGCFSVRKNGDISERFVDEPMGRCMFTRREYADGAAVRAGYKAGEYTIEKILI